MHCILHVGMPKTGTSSIQRFVRVRRQALADLGVFVPDTPHGNMREFAVANDRFGFLREASSRPGGIKGADTDTYFDRIEQVRLELEGQLEAARASGATRLLITSENLFYLGQPERAVESARTLELLRDWLARYCDGVTILMALRRQDLWSISKYRNAVKSESTGGQMDCLQPFPMMDYDGALRLWEAAFGRENIRLSVFRDSTETPEGVLEGFCRGAGIDSLYDPKLEAEFSDNSAVDGRAIETIRRLTQVSRERLDKPVEATQLRGEVYRLLETVVFDGPMQRVRPARQDAIDLVGRYADGNEAVRARYFPQAPTLFTDDYSMFPETADYPQPTMDDLLHLLARLISEPRLEKLITKGRDAAR